MALLIHVVMIPILIGFLFSAFITFFAAILFSCFARFMAISTFKSAGERLLAMNETDWADWMFWILFAAFWLASLITQIGSVNEESSLGARASSSSSGSSSGSIDYGPDPVRCPCSSCGSETRKGDWFSNGDAGWARDIHCSSCFHTGIELCNDYRCPDD